MKSGKLHNNKFVILLYILCSIIPFIIAVGDIYAGRIAFWYDPARDFLLALQNINNPTLIGQPSGLPGLFYGPYWIWIISLLTLISKDPRIISFLLLTVPYFTIFPFILFKISKKWGTFIFISLWLLFILNFGNYTNQIWNVHYAALFLLLSIYLFINPSNKKYKKNLDLVLLGISTGLIANFHLSLGIPSLAAFLLSLIFVHLLERKNELIRSIGNLINKIGLYLFGLFLSFTPFLFFELRHNFIQSRTFIKAIANSIIYNTASVGQTGMSDGEILKSFFGKFIDLLGLSSEYLNLILVFIILSVIFLQFKKSTLSLFEKRLLVLIFCISLLLNASFIFNENPTWGYYFIGVEILFMLYVGLFLSKVSSFKYLIIIFILFSFAFSMGDIEKSFEKNDFSNSDLGTRSHIVSSIFKDAEGDFQYFAYSSAIYTYEYDYLFKWYDEMNDKNINNNSSIIYLVIPKVEDYVREDFINYKTPRVEYDQHKKWTVPDGTMIYKMIKK